MSDEPTNDLTPLVEGAARLGFTLSERQQSRFQLYYETLLDWNSRINLTSITDYEAVQIRHFVDSLTVGATLLDELTPVGQPRPQQPPAGFSLLDVGAGAGFPGAPLKIIWPDIHLVLNDSIGKKATFLKALAEALNLKDVEVVTARAEELGLNKAHRARYNAVTARAVASLPVLCEYCLPLVKAGGWMLAPKKGDISTELREAVKASKILGGGEPKLHQFRLQGEEEERYVIAISKVRPTPPGYPRRIGLAKARPLGGG
ncbi:MAG: 16S rRNA (guanine(527)-N(7))-methyltransferase RsmG [Chloroflexi bacterium]|nr:16S rRNA (guanine(527)-N(7))-methyltransferase RsmG [Chloroflexota bacterium]